MSTAYDRHGRLWRFFSLNLPSIPLWSADTACKKFLERIPLTEGTPESDVHSAKLPEIEYAYPHIRASCRKNHFSNPFCKWRAAADSSVIALVAVAIIRFLICCTVSRSHDSLELKSPTSFVKIEWASWGDWIWSSRKCVVALTDLAKGCLKAVKSGTKKLFLHRCEQQTPLHSGDNCTGILVCIVPLCYVEVGFSLACKRNDKTWLGNQGPSNTRTFIYADLYRPVISWWVPRPRYFYIRFAR